ncbi:pyrroline-5-carboxylate reductase [Salipaludibacillus agaradhaerens]|uniref:pyrroline-5-carboxylate reductase n=1 Tax=Salipaludibacillus agaradhaerens TaxID=76935 RepID=UPI002151CF5D|nr:pyrroline-5-carboxylate reductase [Salipaludibacillus agaradhaerens]MCR6106475.1 pyrroline-5-carboxylate reductase [Salipaludibacillus agaradhaerens]MCR6118508.1 pyrroline-5-carboxylate reductase [Salipaludibacillus agaradhaerens]UJW57606.1 pyrroline-5-carboxylate reductase [Bacillus sp. A116_S68]
MNTMISILGAGSMAEALICGWVKSGQIAPQNILVTNRSNDKRLEELSTTYGVKSTRNIEELIAHAHILLIACKPKDWQQAVKPLQHLLTQDIPLVSVMAGITTEALEDFFPTLNAPVIRTIPNTSAVVNASMTPIALGKWVNQDHLSRVKDTFKLVGETAEVPEDTMDALTALTGTGPAYIYYLMEAMELAAVKIGVDQNLARHLVSQTLLGAGLRVQANDSSPAILYQQIMSPGGTTEAGFNVLREQKMQEIIISCIEKAAERSKELGSLTNERTLASKNVKNDVK